MAEFTSKIRTIEWIDTYSRMVDQTKFPEHFDYVDIKTGQDMFDAIKTMSNISKMFPVIFYLVAVLISLTSMTRMIEEERIEIGTLKYDTEGLNYRNNNDLDNISKDKREYFSRRMMIINSAFGAFTQRKVVCWIIFITKHCLDVIFYDI